MKRLPDWLLIWIWRSLLGAIYPSIRAIAVRFSPDREFRVRLYLDREPTDDDYENLSNIISNIEAETSSSNELPKIFEECVYSTTPLGDLDALDGFVYARRE